MTPHAAYFTEMRESHPAKFVCLGDDTKHQIQGQGTIRLDLHPAQHVEIPDVLYVPGLTKNLVLVRKIDQSGCYICFGGGKCVVESSNDALLATGHLDSDDLYHLDMQAAQAHAATSTLHFTRPSNTYLWHLRLGHANFRKLVHMYKKRMVDGLTLDELQNFGVCTSCVLGKHKRTPFPNASPTRATELLGLVHSDLCGPLPCSLGGKEYFLTFIDDYSRFCVVYFLRHKSETYACFMEYKTWAELQTGHKLKMLRSDNGGEYLSGEFIAFCVQHGIARQLTTPNTPQQNGVAEHKNVDLETSGSSMLQFAHLPKTYWAEAVAYATYIPNRIEHRAVPDKTLYELWTGMKPSVAHMHVFGSVVYAQVHKDHRKKFDPKSKPYIFVGFTEGIKGYKLLHKQTRKVIHSRDVVFIKGVESGETVGAPAATQPLEDDTSSDDQDEMYFGDMVVPIPAPQQVPAPATVPAPTMVPPQRTAAPVRPPTVAQSPRIHTPIRTPGRVVSNRSLYDSPSSHVTFNLDNVDEDEPEEVRPTVQQRRKDKHAHFEPCSSSRICRPPDFYVPEDNRHPKSHLSYCLAAYMRRLFHVQMLSYGKRL